MSSTSVEILICLRISNMKLGAVIHAIIQNSAPMKDVETPEV
jgi:hypothetical protein